MAERRSLGEALSLSPEKVQFIKSDKNGASAEPLVNAESNSTGDTPTTIAGDATERMASQAGPQKITRTSAPQYAPTLVSITTRLQQKTAASLRRAYLEQKLDGQLPDTQQQIIEDALQQWLYERGFLE